MNVLSLFDGISCGQLAMDDAHIKVDSYFASEVCEYSIKIAKKNYPNTIHLGDVRFINRSMFTEKIDIIIGGSPCRDMSICGLKRGLSTKEKIEVTTLQQYLSLKEQGYEFIGQSYLVWEYVRLIKELNPKYFLLENVPMAKKWKDAISEALGVEPITINSDRFSAQERERLYWTNIPIVEPTFRNSLVLKDILEKEVSEEYFYNYPLEEVDLSKQVCAKMIYNNQDMHKRVFNEEFKCHTLTACRGGNTQKKVYVNGRARKLTPLEYERLQTLPDNYTEGIAKTNRYNVCGDGWTMKVISYIFSFLPDEYKEEQ